MEFNYNFDEDGVKPGISQPSAPYRHAHTETDVPRHVCGITGGSQLTFSYRTGSLINYRLTGAFLLYRDTAN